MREPLMPDHYELTPHERVEVIDRDPETLLVLATYAPGGSAPPNHLHPDQDERFEVLSGSLRVVVGGEERTLRPGEPLAVPRGTPHRMWNADPVTEVEVRWSTSPPGRTEQWWAELSAARGERDRPPPLALLRLLRRYRDVFRLVVPGPLRPVVAALLGYLRG